MKYPINRDLHTDPIARLIPAWIDNGEQWAICPEHKSVAVCSRNAQLIDMLTDRLLTETIIGNTRCVTFTDESGMSRTMSVVSIYAITFVGKDFYYSYIHFHNGDHNDIRLNNLEWKKMIIEDPYYARELISFNDLSDTTMLVTIWDGCETSTTVKLLSMTFNIDIDTTQRMIDGLNYNDPDAHMASCFIMSGNNLIGVEEVQCYGMNTVLNYFEAYVNVDVNSFDIFKTSLLGGNNTDFIIYK